MMKNCVETLANYRQMLLVFRISFRRVGMCSKWSYYCVRQLMSSTSYRVVNDSNENIAEVDNITPFCKSLLP